MHTTCFVSVIKSKWNAPVRSSTIFIIETERRARATAFREEMKLYQIESVDRETIR